MIESYLTILEQSLVKKNAVLDAIIENNQKQAAFLEREDLSLDGFDACMEDKGKLTAELERLDEGFSSVYQGVAKELQDNKEMYATAIRRLQQLIQDIMDKSVLIQAAESRNKASVEQYFKKQRLELGQGRRSSKAAFDYYQSMNNRSLEIPQFLDKKK